MIDLSILIPYIRRHEASYHKLWFNLVGQILPYAGQIEILDDPHEYDLVGTKRNRLLERATGKYLCFFDADDTPSHDYIDQVMKGIESGCDCTSLRGEISIDGKFDGVFEHSIKYKEWKTTKNEVKYERYPNHLNCIKSEIAKLFKFPDINHGEDADWSTQIFQAGSIKTEHYIDDIIYYYDYESNKK